MTYHTIRRVTLTVYYFNTETGEREADQER
jgi:hypothetical protein